MILNSLIDDLPLNEAYQSTLDLYQRDIGKSASTFCDELYTTAFMCLEPILQDDRIPSKVCDSRVFASNIGSFRYLIEETYVYVDKSMLIKRIFQSQFSQDFDYEAKKMGKDSEYANASRVLAA